MDAFDMRTRYVDLTDLLYEYEPEQAKELYDRLLTYRKPYRRLCGNGYYVEGECLLNAMYGCYRKLLDARQWISDGEEVILPMLNRILRQDCHQLDDWRFQLEHRNLAVSLEELARVFDHTWEGEEWNFLCSERFVIAKVCYAANHYFPKQSSFFYLLVYALLGQQGLGYAMCFFTLEGLKQLQLPPLIEDETKGFLRFLSWWDAQIEEIMLSYRQQDRMEDVTELKEKYPFLTMNQLLFYHEHQTPAHYYTIQQYMEACSVCYETGRMQLEQLVKLGWYRKRKIGKKFVYCV